MEKSINIKEGWDPAPYKIKIKIGDDEFIFQSPDRATLEEVGLKLLKKTFGRYNNPN